MVYISINTEIGFIKVERSAVPMHCMESPYTGVLTWYFLNSVAHSPTTPRGAARETIGGFPVQVHHTRLPSVPECEHFEVSYPEPQRVWCTVPYLQIRQTESISTLKGLSWRIIGFFCLALTRSWATWPRSMNRSVAWPAVPTVPSTIPRLFSRPAGNSTPPRPWIFPAGILPFTEAWASYLLSAQRSTTPSGSMVSSGVTVVPTSCGYLVLRKQTVTTSTDKPFLHFLF